MYRSKFFKLLLLAGILILLVAACASGDDTEATEEPGAAEPTSAPTEELPEPEESSADEPASTDEPADSGESTEAPSAEADETRIEVTMAGSIPCLAEPKETGDGIGVISQGTLVTMLGRGVGAGWIAIEFPTNTDIVCWLHETDVVYDGDFSEMAIYGRSEGTDNDEPIVLPDGFESEVLVDIICLFGPGSGYTTVRALLAGETVIVWGRGLGSGWYVVAIPATGDNCWLPEDSVDFTGDREELTILNSPPKQ